MTLKTGHYCCEIALSKGKIFNRAAGKFLAASVLKEECGHLRGDACQAIPINSEEGCNFESELFLGRMVFFATGLPSSPADLFLGKKRKSWLMVQVRSTASTLAMVLCPCSPVNAQHNSCMQGSFKEDVRVDEVLTGHHFVRPLRNLPLRWILRGLIALAQRLSPSIRIRDTSAPFILSPLVSTANCIHVAESSQVPPLSPAAEPVEDMRLLSPMLTMTAGRSLREEVFSCSLPTRQ